MGECFFWYRPTRVVPDQRPLNGRCCSADPTWPSYSLLPHLLTFSTSLHGCSIHFMVLFILTLMPLLSTLSFHSLILLISSSSVSVPSHQQSAYSSSHGRETLNSLDMSSMTITNNSEVNDGSSSYWHVTKNSFLPDIWPLYNSDMKSHLPNQLVPSTR